MSGLGRVRRWLVAWLAVASVAHADTPDPDRALAAQAQVRLWLDMGELGKAVAMTRRGVRDDGDDARWHRLRLEALFASGMDAWIQAEYGDLADMPADVRMQHDAWAATTGPLSSAEVDTELPGADLVRGETAFRAGDLDLARDVALGGEGLAHLSLRVRVMAALEDHEGLARAVLAWPTGERVPLVGLAPAVQVRPKGPLRRALKTLWRRVDDRIETADHPLPLLQAAELALAADDRDRLEAIARKLVALGERLADPQALMDALSTHPGTLRSWEIPPRAALDAEALAAAVKGREKDDRPDVPWGRAWERRRMAEVLAERLRDAHRELQADVVLARHLGPCAPSLLPDVLVARGSTKGRRDGRALAEEALIRCMGGVDVTPDEDPAGLDVAARVDELATAWDTFGRVMDTGRWFDDAALAFGMAARLAPSDERVRLARQRAEVADFPVARDGLPTSTWLVERMVEETWLHPRKAVEASRARRGRAEVAALLEPTPARLAEAVPPDRLCLPTLRDWCDVRRAASRIAARRARLPEPDGLPPKSEGARRAGDTWLDDLKRLRFTRDATIGTVSGSVADVRDLRELLDAEGALRVGATAPRFRMSGVRAIDLRGDVVVLSIWASWCRPCQAQLLVLDGMATRWAAEGLPVRVIAVSVDDDPDRYRRALATMDWQSLDMTRDDRVRRVFQAEQLPTVAVIDAAGVLRGLRSGYGPGGLGWLDDAVRAWSAVASSDPGQR